MWALRLGSRTSRPSWQSVWIAARTVGRATPNSAASSSSGSRTPGSIMPSRMRARSETTTASVVEIGRTASPLIRPRPPRAARSMPEIVATPSARTSGRQGSSAAASSAGATARMPRATRLLAPARRSGHVEHAPGGYADATGVEVAQHGLEGAAEQVERAGALAAGDGDHASPGPDGECHGFARATQGARHRDDAGERLLAALLAAVAALAGQALEPARQPVSVRQRLHAPA